MREKLSQIPANVVSIADYEAMFKEFVSHDVYEYIASGVADDLTLKENQIAFEKIKLNRRVLADFSAASTQCKVLGEVLQFPILLAPVAHQGLLHSEAELATAQAANALNVGMVVSTLSSTTLEQIATELQTPKWFQLYFQADRSITLDLVKRAESSGYSAIVVTVDAPINGLRNRAQRAGFTLPDHVKEANLVNYQQTPPRQLGAGESVILNGIMADAVSWQDIEWLQQQTQLPIILKGITHPEDAKKAKQLGLAGVVVSNHGGRTLDCMPAAIEVLADIRQAVGNEFTILFDSGIRRGTDIFKALALGADAVLIGRPQVYGLAVAGALGVAHILRLFIEEFEMTMALMGCATIEQINLDCIHSKSG